MIMFWLICGVFVAIALAFVLPPLLQRGKEEPDNGEKEANVNIYRDQLSELEADLRNGIISAEQYRQDRDEIERRLLEDVSATGKRASGQTKQTVANRGPVYAIALGIPVIAVALYFLLGNSAAMSSTGASAFQPPFTGNASGNGPMTQQGIEANVAALAKRLEQNPADAQGWIMLGRSYIIMEKYGEASNAYAKATALKPDNADLWADYAFASGMANGRRLQGPPLELVKKALQLDPDNPKALELAGSAAFEAKNYQDAVNYWQRLLQKTQANSELAQALTQRINEAKSLAGAGMK